MKIPKHEKKEPCIFFILFSSIEIFFLESFCQKKEVSMEERRNEAKKSVQLKLAFDKTENEKTVKSLAYLYKK